MTAFRKKDGQEIDIFGDGRGVLLELFLGLGLDVCLATIACKQLLVVTTRNTGDEVIEQWCLSWVEGWLFDTVTENLILVLRDNPVFWRGSERDSRTVLQNPATALALSARAFYQQRSCFLFRSSCQWSSCLWIHSLIIHGDSRMEFYSYFESWGRSNGVGDTTWYDKLGRKQPSTIGRGQRCLHSQDSFGMESKMPGRLGVAGGGVIEHFNDVSKWETFIGRSPIFDFDL